MLVDTLGAWHRIRKNGALLGSVFFRPQDMQGLKARCTQHDGGRCSRFRTILCKWPETLTCPERGAKLRGLSTWCTHNRLGRCLTASLE